MTSAPAVERLPVGRGDDPASTAAASPAVMAAQAALVARRLALGVVTRPALDQGQGVEAAASRARPSAAERGQAALEARRLELGINYRRPTVEPATWSAWAAERADGAGQVKADPLAWPLLTAFYGAGKTFVGALDQAATSSDAPGRDKVGHIAVGHAAASTGRPLPFPEDDQGQTNGGALAGVKATVYPRLAAAILQAGQARPARLWLVLLASEPTRRGSYNLDQVYETFSGAGSAWRIGGRRCVQQVLKAGRGVFWTLDKRGRLWRRGPARVGGALGLAGAVGAPVEVPVTDLLGGMYSVRARLFAAALSAHDDPIGQDALTELTGACPNSQRAYRQLAGVEARPQYRFLPGVADRPALQEAHWRHGRGVFVFADYSGQQGQGRGALLLAKRDPNVYAAALGPARRGRTRKINRRLNLVTNGARGNGSAVDYERFYFQDAAAAGSAYNRARGRHDVAYRHGQGRRVDFWGTIAALDGVGG